MKSKRPTIPCYFATVTVLRTSAALTPQPLCPTYPGGTFSKFHVVEFLCRKDIQYNFPS